MQLYPVSNRSKKMEIDDEDVVAISFHTWYHSNKYNIIYACVDGKTTTIGQFVAKRMGLSLINDIDHRDRNIFNNKRDNLREATRSQNNMNKKAQVNNKLGIKGVCFNKSKGKYEAYIKMNYEKIHLGSFNTKEEAKETRVRAEKHHFKEFACTD